MTGYHITIGYNSGPIDTDEAWRILKDFALSLCAHPEVIAAEAIAFGMNESTAKEYAQAYKERVDGTIRFKEAESDDQPAQIIQLASGGGESRHIKEAMRRAFCRLVLVEMHRRKIEVNINVA